MGPIPWTAKEVRVIQGTSGHIIAYGTEVMTVKATDLLFRRRDREGRSFHFIQAKLATQRSWKRWVPYSIFWDCIEGCPSKAMQKSWWTLRSTSGIWD